MNFTGLLGASCGSYFIIWKWNFEHLTEFSLNEKLIASVVDANYGRFFLIVQDVMWVIYLTHR